MPHLSFLPLQLDRPREEEGLREKPRGSAYVGNDGSVWWCSSQWLAPGGLTHPSLVACLFSKLLCLWENLPTRPRQTHLSRVSLCLILYAFDLLRLISARGWQLYLVVKAWATSGPGVSKTTAPPYMSESGLESLRADWCSLGLWALL